MTKNLWTQDEYPMVECKVSLDVLGPEPESVARVLLQVASLGRQSFVSLLDATLVDQFSSDCFAQDLSNWPWRSAVVVRCRAVLPLDHADEATLARRFAQEIRRLAPGASLVIRNAEGSHTFTPPESP